MNYGKDNVTLEANECDLKVPVYIENCKDTVIFVKGKCNAITLMKC